MAFFRTIKNIKNLYGKRVLMRVDFNFTLKDGKPIDSFRLKAIFPTLEFLKPFRTKLILISHFGEPKGKFDKKYSLEPIAKWLLNQDKIFQNLKFIVNPFDKEGGETIQNLKEGDIALLENIRFWKGEEENNPKFAQKLANFGDIYINEAFSVSHRAHSSITGLPKILPSYAGINFENEVNNLNQVLKKYHHPFTLILGGAKISTKLGLLLNFKNKANFILIGGAMANTFLKAKESNIGNSLIEETMLSKAKEILKQKNLILPNDVMIKMRNKKIRIIDIDKLNDLKHNDFKILDIGPKTIKKFSDIIKTSKEIIWNGPLGYFEEKPFTQGTVKIIQSILSNKKARITIGGGETIVCLGQAKVKRPMPNAENKIFVSTGGGAMLEFLSGKELPGLIALTKNKDLVNLNK